MPKTILTIKDYPALKRKVEEILLLGQRKIEQAKVETYWQTGKIISDHILSQKAKDNYGRQIIERLSSDLKISQTVLWRCVRFARSFKILAARPESFPKRLSWAHYRELITVPDEQTRLLLMRRAQKKGWSSRELSQNIREEVNPAVSHKTVGPKKTSYPKLIPRRGELYTYQIIETDPLHKKYTDGLRIDLGFKIHQKLPQLPQNLKNGQIIESIKNDDYKIVISKRKMEDLFTYKAFVERVVDGDTLYVDIDLGFGAGTFQYLRLRGINCPELDTLEGKKAKAFVERELSKVPHIILTSSRSDKYDRYLADVWLPTSSDDSRETSDDVYLNQVLLDQGLAERTE